MPRALLVNKEDVLSAAEETGSADLISELRKIKTVAPSSADIGIPPILKTERSMAHVLYSDGHGALESQEYTEWLCPVCDCFVGSHRVTRYGEKKKPCNFCTQCGQKIDWSGIELDDNYAAPEN